MENMGRRYYVYVIELSKKVFTENILINHIAL